MKAGKRVLVVLAAGALVGVIGVAVWGLRSTPAPAPPASPSPAPPAPPDARQILEEARVAWRVHDLERVEQRTGAIVSHPSPPPGAVPAAHVLRALVHMNRFRASDAAAEASVARDAPDVEPADRALAAAIVHLMAREPARARAQLEQALIARPDDLEALELLAALRRVSGDLEGAVAGYSRLLELEPRYVAAWHDRGVAKLGLKDLEGAEADLTRALELDPTWGSTALQRARVHLARQDQTAARHDLQRALASSPPDSPTAAEAGQLLARVRAAASGQ